MSEAIILKIICGNGGAIEYERLLELASGFPDINCSEFDSLIKNKQFFFQTNTNGVTKVLAKTNVRLCKEGDCTSCSNLHLCKFYLHGECHQRPCRYGHNLNSDHNAKVLSDHQLKKLNRAEIRHLLLQNDSPHSLLPPICAKYNRGDGDYGQCEDKDSCRRLHICEGYIRGTCDLDGCGRSHDFSEPHPMRTLRGRGVPSRMVGSMLFIYQNILVLRGTLAKDVKSSAAAKGRSGKNGKGAATSSSDATKDGSNPTRQEIDEICLFFVRADCKQGNKCWRVHSKMPYQWQVKAGETWTDLPNNEDIERDFCNPSSEYQSTALSVGGDPVCFDTMTCGPHEVRRLSTPSFVLKPDFVLTTEWLWYWKDEYGKWILYASIKEMHRMSSVSSSDLESRYQEDTNAVVTFTAGQEHYELSFQDMVQKNMKYGTLRRLRRRPKFISSNGVQIARTSKRRGPASSQHYKGVPGYWDKSAVPDTGYKKVDLPSDDRDYLKVQELFRKTLSGFDILSIERIQNKELWEDFQTKRERMKKANKDKKYGDGERLLFHGTDSKFIDAICFQNFDWRKCGANGTVYGQGCYFARDARYSNSYTSGCGNRSMFVCRVLVGSYTQGHSHYRLPPSRDGGLILYDSCVNDVRDPSIFVVFDKQQVYPEFLITYTEHVYHSLSATLTDSPSNSGFSTTSNFLSTVTSTQSNSTPSSTVFTGIASAPQIVPVSTVVSSSPVSPSSVVPSPTGRLASVSLATGQKAHLSSRSSVTVQMSNSFTSALAAGTSSPSSDTTSTKPPANPIPHLSSKSSDLNPSQVLPFTSTTAVSATPSAPVPSSSGSASTSLTQSTDHPLQAARMSKTAFSSSDWDFVDMDPTVLPKPQRSSSATLIQQSGSRPDSLPRLYPGQTEASLNSSTVRSATPQSTSTRRMSPPYLSSTTPSYTRSMPRPTSYQDLYNVPRTTPRRDYGTKKKDECILL